MPIRNRAETDVKNPPGQYTHGPARPSTVARSVLKLGDYVDHVKASEERTERLNLFQKYSFDEWWGFYGGCLRGYSLTGEMAEEIWNAAQENK